MCTFKQRKILQGVKSRIDAWLQCCWWFCLCAEVSTCYIEIIPVSKLGKECEAVALHLVLF